MERSWRVANVPDLAVAVISVRRRIVVLADSAKPLDLLMWF
jgi:hypothetical protein